MPKKIENQNKSLQSECLIKFAFKNVVLNEFLLILFHYLMFINYMKTFIGKFYQFILQNIKHRQAILV
jgi:hypothetical protein